MKDFIKEFWDSQANKYKSSHWASWGDTYAIDLEVENIGNYIKNGDEVLDVGCANGASTIRQMAKKPSLIHGVDFSESMIKEALNFKTDRIKFSVADVRELPFKDESFDVVYTTRCLINLPTWADQVKGIKECVRVAKRVVVLSEAFWEPLVKLNALRIIADLPPLVEHDFNRYIKKEKLSDFLDYEFKCDWEIKDFSCLYYLGSRFIRELIITEESDNKLLPYENPLNELFSKLEKRYSCSGFGIQQLIVIHK